MRSPSSYITKTSFAKPAEHTVTVDLILNHYRENGITAGWNRERFHKLAEMLGLNKRELGVLCGMYRFCRQQGTRSKGNSFYLLSLADDFLRKDHFAPSESLHLAFLESWLLRMRGELSKDPEIMPLNLLKL